MLMQVFGIMSFKLMQIFKHFKVHATCIKAFDCHMQNLLKTCYSSFIYFM